ncbi:MAG: macro domain-containing protein [Rhabdochlamydiaceae bacterium]|nr:macro domain-containing protein [Rhabdochlamydiaceae bacterium]
MGKGIAFEFKKRFPDMFRDYERRCERREVVLGKPYLYKPERTISKESQSFLFAEDDRISGADRWILNFPTKDHWRSLATLKSIIAGLEFLLQHYKEWGIQSLAMPPLGCGEGQLEWRVIGPTLFRYLREMDIPVELYAPYNTPHEELQVQFLASCEKSIQMPDPKWIPASWIGLIEIIKRLKDQPHHQDCPVGKVIFQKIAYAATKAGIATELIFKKESYGPFSSDLQKNVLSRLVNNGLIIEESLGRMQSIMPGPTFADARKAYANELEVWNPIIDRVVDLFMRLNTEQAEIIASVMFASDQLTSNHQTKPHVEEVLSFVMEWKQNKQPPLSRKKVEDAIRNLAILDWIEVRASNSFFLVE